MHLTTDCIKLDVTRLGTTGLPHLPRGKADTDKYTDGV